MSGKSRSNAIPWTAFLLGAGASIAANVAHAAERNAEGTDIGAMLFAAWAPVALLLVAEMMVRGQRPRGLLSAVEWIGAFLVALAAAVVSYGHMRGLLLQYGESELVAVLLPLSVDGLVVVASVALAAGRRNKVEQQWKAEQQRNKPEQQGDEERKEEQSPERKEERDEEQQRNEERKTEQERKAEQQRNKPEQQGDEERKEEQSPERKEERDEEQQRNEERKTEQERKAEQQRNTEQRKDEERKTEQQRDEERNVRVPVVEVGSPTTVPVTVTPPHSAERRSAVEWVAEQLRNGATLTGAEIGARYGRTDRWGRNVLRDARQQLAAAVPA